MCQVVQLTLRYISCMQSNFLHENKRKYCKKSKKKIEKRLENYIGSAKMSNKTANSNTKNR